MKLFRICVFAMLIFGLAGMLMACSESGEEQDEQGADATLSEDIADSDLVTLPEDTTLSADVAVEDIGDEPVPDTDGNSDEECTVNEDCVESQGFPAAPPVPCGNCYAVCENNTCGAICYEAADCIFTAGCGPNCEPLCNTTEDCFDDLGQICVDGICVYPEDLLNNCSTMCALALGCEGVQDQDLLFGTTQEECEEICSGTIVTDGLIPMAWSMDQCTRSAADCAGIVECTRHAVFGDDAVCQDACTMLMNVCGLDLDFNQCGIDCNMTFMGFNGTFYGAGVQCWEQAVEAQDCSHGDQCPNFNFQ